jgi:heat shock protein HslJ
LFQGKVQDLGRIDSKTGAKPSCHAELVSASGIFFSAFGRHMFHPRPQHGVFRCAFNKMIQNLLLLTVLLHLGCGLTSTENLPDINFDKIVFLSSRTQSGNVQLVNGEYHGPAGPGSAAETLVKLTDARAFGKLGGKEAGAVILSTDPGGSGTFYDLALLIKGPQGWINQDSTFLGDRIKIHSLTVADEAIVVDLTTQGPGDPMCCPTLRVVQRFVLRENRLVKASEEVRGEADQMLIGIVWKWQQSLYNNDTKAVPTNPGNYTLKLLPDGKVSIRADCNLGGGVYRLDGSKVSIEITHTTRAACPPESLEQKYIRDLNAAAIYFFKADVLYIDLNYDTGTMKFMH